MENNYFDLTRLECKPDEAIRFLNSPAIEFYNNKYTFKDSEFAMLFKSSMLMAINDIENVFKGCFDTGLSLNNIDYGLFKSMFKRYASFNIEKKAEFASRVLSKIRNLNAHFKPSKSALELFDCNFDFLLDLYPINKRIYYFVNNQLTLAGLITFVTLFLRDQSILKLTKSSPLFGLITRGFVTTDNGSFFAKTKSRVNLELPIRSEICHRIRSSVVGRYNMCLNEQDDGTYLIEINNYKEKSFEVKFQIADHVSIKIFKGSRTKVFYTDDYELIILDEEKFAELSSKFPPFVFVDLLYKLNIEIFDNKTYNQIVQKMYRYEKLNYPKFYVDKNIDILLLPDSIADFRIVNSTVNNSLVSLFLRIESRILKDNQEELEDADYSTISDALSALKADNSLLTDVRVLRNFAFHNAIFGEFNPLGNELIQYSLEFVFTTIIKLEQFLKSYSSKFNAIFSDIKKIFIQRIIYTKYNSLIDYTFDFLNGSKVYPDPNASDVVNKFRYIKASIIDDGRLNDFFIDREPSCFVKEYAINDNPRHLFIKDSKEENKMVNDYLESLGNIESITSKPNGVIEFYEVKIK